MATTAPQRTAPSAQPPSRRIGLVIWGALLAGLVVFGAVVLYVGGLRPPPSRGLGQLLFYVSSGVSAVMLVASVVLPSRASSPPGAPPDGIALTRTIVASLPNEGAALLATAAWLATGNGWLAAPYLLSLFGLLRAFPSSARWARLGGAVEGGAPRNPLVR